MTWKRSIPTKRRWWRLIRTDWNKSWRRSRSTLVRTKRMKSERAPWLRRCSSPQGKPSKRTDNTAGCFSSSRTNCSTKWRKWARVWSPTRFVIAGCNLRFVRFPFFVNYFANGSTNMTCLNSLREILTDLSQPGLVFDLILADLIWIDPSCWIWFCFDFILSEPIFWSLFLILLDLMCSDSSDLITLQLIWCNCAVIVKLKLSFILPRTSHILKQTMLQISCSFTFLTVLFNP